MSWRVPDGVFSISARSRKLLFVFRPARKTHLFYLAGSSKRDFVAFRIGECVFTTRPPFSGHVPWVAGAFRTTF